VTDSLLGLLKLCLLALVYLFFLRVLWAVWTEVRGTRVAAATGAAPTPKRRTVKRRDTPSRLTVTEPKAMRGSVFALGPEVTVGRAAGCGMSFTDDTYLSNLHARVFQRDGQSFVEDLGSTNGTYLNGDRVTSAVPMRRGDRLQVGSTVLEVG
jgi:pSer/pThr/pTyr-binding forkhead associated (FHA) protein